MNFNLAQIGIGSKQITAKPEVHSASNSQSVKLSPSFDLEFLQSITIKIQTAISPEDISNALMELFRQLIPAKRFEFLNWDFERRRFESLLTCFEVKTNVKKLIESGIIQWIFNEKKSAVIPDLDNYSSENQIYFVVVPIILMNKNAGIFLLQTEVDKSCISKSLLNLITTVVNQAFLSLMAKKLSDEKYSIKNELSILEEQISGASLIGNLDAGYFHQMKNKLQVILSSIQLIQKGIDPNNLLNILKQETQKVCELTKKISDYFKPFSNQEVYEYVNLNQLLNSARDVTQFVLNESQIRINLIENPKQPQVYTCSSFLRKSLFYFIYQLGQTIGKNGSINLETIINEHRITVKIQTDEINIDKDLLKNLFDEQKDIKYKALKKKIMKNNWSIVTRLAENKKVTILLTLPKKFRSKMRKALE
ncbi:MAG: hypothetical protein N3A61_00495 [Ignavibacteria bacterium]|nr:hypothetical protein [Ignavibacteria bacterium]